MLRPDPESPILQEARTAFRAFYESASPSDAAWMDLLVFAWASFTRGTSIPREFIAAEERDSLERACDNAEREFMRARDQVRATETFRGLVPGDQRRIELVLFNPFPPHEWHA